MRKTAGNSDGCDGMQSHHCARGQESMMGEAKKIRDHMNSLDAEIKKLTNEREEWWVKLRRVQEQCKHLYEEPGDWACCVRCGVGRRS